ncbi:hypothetical protein [Streptomyces sioyaensis]|uniref:hypothetical protein n=1 Tax=Streptomyces sioyaensis TaxID=67364 RepID=UPI003796D12F
MTNNTQAAWPEGVIARYITVAGVALADPELAVEVTSFPAACCKGCGEDDAYDRSAAPYNSPRRARQWAQAHAEKCRAMPRPDGAR